MVNSLIKSGEFEKLIELHNLSNEDIAEKTQSNIRSVYRWRAHGIPRAKFELLKIKLSKMIPIECGGEAPPVYVEDK
jgi:hypothetical protein